MSLEGYREKLAQGCTQLVPLGRPNASRSSLPTSQAPKSPIQPKEGKTAGTESTRPPSPPRLNMSIGPPLTTPRSPRPLPREVQTKSSGSIPPHPPPRITSKDWSVPVLCSRYESFQEVRRVSALSPPEVLAKALEEYEQDGLPLIISDWHRHPKWPQDIFNLEWLIRTSGNSEIHVRNLHNREDQSMTLSEFVKKSQSQSRYAVPGETERLYWKDADCPPEWKDWLLHSGAIPTSVLPASPDDYLGYLFPSEAVESLLCYMGIGDTYTASHKDLCASSGHNLMCFAEENASSFWFMTASNDAPRVAEYFQRKLKQELDWETHVTTVEELGNAPTTVYVAEQKVGDLVLVPSRSCHQVVNAGGLAMKTSWSRMTLDNLDKALHCELPVYRRVCRPEQYRVKTILYRSMLHLTKVLEQGVAESQADNQRERTSVSVDEEIVDGLCNNPAMSELAGYNSPSPEPDFSAPSPDQSSQKLAECGRKLKRLVQLFDEVLREEYSSTHADMEHTVPYKSSTGWKVADGLAADDSGAGSSSSSGGRLILCPPADQLKRQEEHYERSRNMSYTLACDFCGADIFQSFFECNHCRKPEAGSEAQVGDGLLICPGCYVEGRSCHCERLEPIQCRPFDTLLLDRNVAAKVLSCVLPPEAHLEPLEKSRIVLTSNSCVFEAACTLHLLRKQRHEKPEKNSRKCRLKNADSHEMYFDEGLNCGTCHSSTCFRHLLAKGTHAVQAILKHRIGDAKSRVYHDTHKANAAALERRTKKTHVELDKLRHVHERMLAAALSFPKCRPGHPKVKLGWYDRENTLVVTAEQTTATPAAEDVRGAGETRAHEPISEPSSPLTPVESDIDSLFDAVPPREEGQLNRSLPKQPESAVTVPSGDDHSIIELTSSEPESEPPSPVMSAAHCYVKMPPLPSYASDLKRAASTSGPSLASRKKPRVADVDDPDEPRHALNAVGGTRRPRHSHVSSGAAIVREDSPMEDESNTVAMNLVRALSLANNEVPIYTNRPGQGRKRIIESDSEEMPDSPPHMNDSRHPPEEARTSARPAPAVASATTSLRSAPSDTYSGATPPLPRTSTLKRPRAEEALDTHERRAQPRHTVDMSGLAKDSVPAASDRPPKKRKGPPGLSQEEVVRRTSAQQQQQMREEQTAHRGPEPRKKSYSKSTHSVVKRPSTRAVEPPERRISRTDPPSFSSAENSFARPPASMEAQRFDEQDADMITFGSTNDDVAGTSSTAPTAVTVPLLSATEGSGTSQAVVAISGASDSTHVPASVSIRASVSASAGTPAPLFKQPPPALSMRTISARETDHPQPSRSVPLLAMLNSHNQADVTFGTLFESIRHLAAAGLATEQQGQRFEAALQSLQSEVRTLVQGKRNVEEELGSMKEQLRTLSGKLHADREERARQATVIRDLQQKCDRLEAGFSDRVREIVVPMITAHLQQMQYAPSAPPAPGPAAVGMPGPSHEYQHSGYDQGVGLPSGGVDVRPQSWDNNMGSRYGGPPSGFNAPPQDPYVAPPGQYNGRGQDGHFRGRGYGSGQGRHQSNGFPPRGPANGGGDGWNPRHRNDQGSQGGMGPRPNNHAPAQPWQGRGYRDERAYNQRRGSDDARGRPYDDRRRPRSVSRGGNDRRRMSRPPDAPRSESSEHTLRRNTPPSTMDSPTSHQELTRGRSPSDRLPERDSTPLLDTADSGVRIFMSPPGGFM